MTPEVLLLLDDQEFVDWFSPRLQEVGFTLYIPRSLREALSHLRSRPIQQVIMDPEYEPSSSLETSTKKIYDALTRNAKNFLGESRWRGRSYLAQFCHPFAPSTRKLGIYEIVSYR